MEPEEARWAYVPDLEERIGWRLDGGTRGWWHCWSDGEVHGDGGMWFLILSFRPGEVEEVCVAAVKCGVEDVPLLLSSDDEPPASPPGGADAAGPLWRCVDGPAPALAGFRSEAARHAAEMLESLVPFEDLVSGEEGRA